MAYSTSLSAKDKERRMLFTLQRAEVVEVKEVTCTLKREQHTMKVFVSFVGTAHLGEQGK